jgi:hypothetical protein
MDFDFNSFLERDYMRQSTKMRLALVTVGVLALSACGNSTKSTAKLLDSTSVKTKNSALTGATGKACSSGGVCRVGDLTAQGGRVAFIAPAGAKWGSYLEVATPAMFGSDVFTNVTFGCPTKSFGTQRIFGAGVGNTASVVAACTEAGSMGPAITKFNQVRAALGLPGDWFVPSIDEMKEVCVAAPLLGAPFTKLSVVLTSVESSSMNAAGPFKGSSSLNFTSTSSCRSTTQTVFNGFQLPLVPVRIQK